MANDPYFYNNLLLMNFDGDDASTTIEDNSEYGNTISVGGSAQLDTAQAKYGVSSLLLDGVDSNLSVTHATLFDMDDDYTIELDFRTPNVNDGYQALFNFGELSKTLYVYNSTVVWFETSARITSAAISNDTWYHVTLVNKAGTLTLYLDGASQGTYVSAQPDASKFYIGSKAATEWYAGHIDNFRMTRGIVRYAGEFTPLDTAFSTLPTFPLSGLLLHFDGTDGSTTFTDSSLHTQTVSAFGNAQIDTAISKFDGASGLFDGTGDYLTIPDSDWFHLETMPSFTIEVWIYVGTSGASQAILSTRNDSLSKPGWELRVNTDYTVIFYYTGGGNSVPGSTVLTNDTWYHVAVVKDFGVVTLYINGVADGSATLTDGSAGHTPTVGSSQTGTGSLFNGNIDELRLIPYVAKYKANFTPEAQAFVDVRPDYESELLLHFDGVDASTAFIDSSPYYLSVTSSGNAQIDTAISKWGGASGLFDGAGDYLTIPIPPEFNLETMANFTVEAWIRIDVLGVSHTIMSTRDSTNGWVFNVTTSDELRFYHTGGSSIISTGTFAINTWYHVAAVKNNGTVTLYIDGVADGSLAFTDGTVGGALTIGAREAGTAGYFDGNIDDLRLTAYVARYTTNFTPPTGAFPDSGVGIYAIVGDALIKIVNNSILSDFYIGFGIVGDAVIKLINRSLAYKFDILEKPEIVTSYYVCEITGTADGLPDLTVPISNMNQQLNTDGSSSITVICPAGLDYAEGIQARVNGGIIITTNELYSDGSTAISNSEEFTIGSLQSSQGGRNFSVSVTGRRELTFGNNKKHTLQGHSFTSTNAQGRRTIRCKLDKDIFPRDTVILTDGSEMLVDTAAIIISENQQFMSLTE